MEIRRRLGRFAALGSLTLLFALSACVSTGLRRLEGFDARVAEVDRLECTRIELSSEVGIRRRTIRESSVLPEQALHVLEYVELEGLDVERLDASIAYANIYLVAKTRLDARGQQAVIQRYLVTDLWRFCPERRIKVCLQWTIWEEPLGALPGRASLQVFVESYGSRVLEERELTVSQEQLAALSGYYRRMQEAFARRLQTAVE